MFSVVVVCAGSSTRFGGDKNKLMMDYNGKPLYQSSIELFKKYCEDIVIVCNNELCKEISSYHSNVVLGGKNRMDSVYNGVLKAKNELVFIHDGARPCLNEDDLKALIEATKINPYAFLGSKVTDTIRNTDTFEINDRSKLIQSFTPQTVLKSEYIEAYQKAIKDNYLPTDDIALVKKYITNDIKFVEGSKSNIKVTTMDDYKSITKNEYLIGHSWDIHRLVSDRPLYLGGLQIPYDKGLLGHSDGDCVLHAISEALLGTLALGDLGHIFPDNDPNTLGIDSKIILKKCYDMILDKGYEINNLDVMIYAEYPKMKPFIVAIRESIAKLLNINLEKVSVKATTYEKLGEIGQGLAIASDATVLIKKI